MLPTIEIANNPIASLLQPSGKLAYCKLHQKNYTKLTVIRIELDLGMLVKSLIDTAQTNTAQALRVRSFALLDPIVCRIPFMTSMSFGWQHRFIETNSIRLHCVTQGEGDLVVLLHGFPEFWYSWRHQIPVLAQHFKVVVPDLRGYNDSDKPASGYDLDTLSADIQGLIEHLGYAKAHIVGHDWGGTIAWHFAQRFPNLLDRLAILNAPHPQQLRQEMLGNLDQLRRSWYLLALQVPALPEWLIRQNLRGIITNLLQEQSIRKGAFTGKDTEIYQAALEKPGALSAVLNHYRQWLSPQTWIETLGRTPAIVPIKSPTLVLWGEEDFLFSHRLTEQMDKLVSPPLKLKLLQQCGHWVQQEVPQTVNRELLSFLCS